MDCDELKPIYVNRPEPSLPAFDAVYKPLSIHIGQTCYFVDVIENFHADQNYNGLTFALDKMANLCVLTDKPEVAAHLIGWSDANHMHLGDHLPRIEQADNSSPSGQMLTESRSSSGNQHRRANA